MEGQDLPLAFLGLVYRLKTTVREGWRRTIANPESVADHSYMVALYGLFAPEGLDRLRCVLLGLAHDLGETVVGDIPTYANVPKERKRQLEALAFRYLKATLPDEYHDVGDMLQGAWLEYEEAATPEAQFMKGMDKLECLFQAGLYEKSTYGEKDLSEFQGLRAKMTSPRTVQWADQLQSHRAIDISRRDRQLPALFVMGPLCTKEIFRTSIRHPDDYLIVFQDCIEKMSRKETYRYATIIQEFLAAEAELPVALSVHLLEQAILAGGGKPTLVYGFPNTVDQMIEYQKNVQKTNRVLWLGDSDTGNTLYDYVSKQQSFSITSDPDKAKQISKQI